MAPGIGIGFGVGMDTPRDPDLQLHVEVGQDPTLNLVDGSRGSLDLADSVDKGIFRDGLLEWVDAQELARNDGFGFFSPGYVVKNSYWSQLENWTSVGAATAADSGGHTIAGVLSKRITGQTASWHRLQFHYDPDIAAVVTIQAFVQDGTVAPKLYCYDVDTVQNATAIIDVVGKTISKNETAGTFGTPYFREVVGGVVLTVKYVPNNVGNAYSFALHPDSSNPADYCLVAGALVVDGNVAGLTPLNSQDANAVRYSEMASLSFPLTDEMKAALGSVDSPVGDDGVTDGDFSDWTTGDLDEWDEYGTHDATNGVEEAVGGGVRVFSDGIDTGTDQAGVGTLGKLHRVELDVSDVTAGAVRVLFVGSGTYKLINSTGTHVFLLPCDGGSTTLRIKRHLGTTDVSVGNIKVEPLTPQGRIETQVRMLVSRAEMLVLADGSLQQFVGGDVPAEFGLFINLAGFFQASDGIAYPVGPDVNWSAGDILTVAVAWKDGQFWVEVNGVAGTPATFGGKFNYPTNLFTWGGSMLVDFGVGTTKFWARAS